MASGPPRRMGDAVRKRAFEMLDPATLDEDEPTTYMALFERFRAERGRGRRSAIGAAA